VDTLCRILQAAGFEVRMRLAKPDTHDQARLIAETLIGSEELAAYTAKEQVRLTHRTSHGPG
jgi:hypothetical protein